MKLIQTIKSSMQLCMMWTQIRDREQWLNSLAAPTAWSEVKVNIGLLYKKQRITRRERKRGSKARMDKKKKQSRS
ncbi:hypothetical protein K1719_000099 [Acacia pycnantha]|nr:hypothetical protein K1719_000099 [Acacia pycnantha]